MVMVLRVALGMAGVLDKSGGPPLPIPLRKVFGFIDLTVVMVRKFIIIKGLWLKSSF